MKVVLQRVIEASVTINQVKTAEIGKGVLIFVGIVDDDNKEDILWLTSKIANLRIFNDDNGLMNLSVKEVDGEVIVVSQFTLHAMTKKGNRPSYSKAAKPDSAIPLYNNFLQELQSVLSKNVKSGIFGADMKIALINDGPVTILIDSKNKE